MYKLIVIFILTGSFLTSQAQDKYLTRTGTVEFFSSTPIEDIRANNGQVSSILKTNTKEIFFNVLMRSFRFEKALMEEHFNEKYVESEVYPAAKFKGTILDEIDFSKDGTYEDVTVEGTMIFHGVEKEISVLATIVVDAAAETIHCTSDFLLKPEDYTIEIPSVVRDKISDDIQVSTQFVYTKSE